MKKRISVYIGLTFNKLSETFPLLTPNQNLLYLYRLDEKLEWGGVLKIHISSRILILIFAFIISLFRSLCLLQMSLVFSILRYIFFISLSRQFALIFVNTFLLCCLSVSSTESKSTTFTVWGRDWTCNYPITRWS